MVTEAQWQKVQTYLKKGHSRGDAFMLAGIPLQTLRKIAENARLGHVEDVKRMEELDIWEAQSVDRYLGFVERQAEDGNLKAAQLLLKTLRPGRFGSNDKKTEVTVTQAAPQVQQQSGDAKERIFAYALKLFREHPDYLERLHKEMGAPQLPVAEGEIVDSND